MTSYQSDEPQRAGLKALALRIVGDGTFGRAIKRNARALMLSDTKKMMDRMDMLAVSMDMLAVSVEQSLAVSVEQRLAVSMEQRLAAQEFAAARALMDLETRLQEQMIAQRTIFPLNTSVDGSRDKPRAVDPPSLDDAFARLKAAAPLNWESYLRCLDTGTESYEGLPSVSCSTDRHPQSLLFKAFLRPYLRGYVLDIGCGPQPVPSYLGGFPHAQIVGIDPISRQEDHPFPFVSGVGEFLPFQDGAFDVVVSGTTLDHYYLLDKGLEEAARVLQPGGHFVAWITEFAGAPAYDPYTAPMQPYDSEHMYHIDRAWFLPLMDRYGFSPAEVVHFKLPFNYLFMSFVKR